MTRPATLALAILVLAGAAAADWPRFQGPIRDATGPEKGLVRDWPEGGPKVLWTVALGPDERERFLSRDDALDMRRYTAAADVYRTCKDSVVCLGFRRKDPDKPDTYHTEQASGVVLHEAGYLLTNAHLLRHGGAGKAGFSDDREYPVRVVAVDESRDLAVLRLEPDAGGALPRLVPIKLGHSGDLVVGEQVVALGNPSGIGLTVSMGIISALHRATKSDFTFFSDMIQTDASTSSGSSGGPLLNCLGELVGLNTTKQTKAENMEFAIPVDLLREALPEMLAPEGRFGFVLGVTVTSDAPATVAAVATGSPAEAAGVRAGDVLASVGAAEVRNGIDFCLALMDARPGQTLSLRLRRDGRPVEVSVTLAAVEPRAADAVEGLAGGLKREFYQGAWDRLPDFGSLQPATVDRAETFDLGPYRGKNTFALRFTGYVDVPADGIYAFSVLSDEGSRLWIGDRLVVDNDGAHAPTEKRGFIPLKAGKHAITVAYFEGAGGEELRVAWEGPGLAKQPIPASALSSADRR